MPPFLGSSQTWSFQTWLFAILTQKRFFCALLRPFVLFVLFCALAFALIFALLRAFAYLERLRLETAEPNCLSPTREACFPLSKLPPL